MKPVLEPHMCQSQLAFSCAVVESRMLRSRAPYYETLEACLHCLKSLPAPQQQHGRRQALKGRPTVPSKAQSYMMPHRHLACGSPFKGSSDGRSCILRSLHGHQVYCFVVSAPYVFFWPWLRWKLCCLGFNQLCALLSR